MHEVSRLIWGLLAVVAIFVASQANSLELERILVLVGLGIIAALLSISSAVAALKKN